MLRPSQIDYKMTFKMGNVFSLNLFTKKWMSIINNIDNNNMGV